MECIVRSVDIGYGFTKYVRDVKAGGNEYGRFPSLAPVASGRALDDSLGRRRNTIVMKVDGVNYEVGPDVELAQQAVPIRNLDDDYVMSPAYRALLRGALAFMKKDVVDVLVVGLPVSVVKLRRKALEKLALGTHEISKTKTVTVSGVKVLAQPHGALLDFAARTPDSRQVLQQTNLVIDSGYRTFDWLVTQGLKPVESRSGSVSRGMHDVLRVISDRIASVTGSPYHAFARLDEALRFGRPPRIHGKEFRLDSTLAVARQVAADAVTEMKRALQGSSDIDNIILVGGAAHFFRPVIESEFRNRRLTTVREEQFANLRGFQLAGLEWARETAKAAA